MSTVRTKNGVKFTQKQFIHKLDSVHNGEIIPLGKYESSHSKLKVQCRTCDNVWEVRPYSLLAGHGCSKCKGGGKKWSHKEYEKKLKEVHGDNIQVIQKYVDSQTPIKHKCSHGHIWSTGKPIWILRGVGCPKCQCSRLFPIHSNSTDITEFTARVRAVTNKVYSIYESVVNPKGLRRSKDEYVIDHKYSIHDAFYNPNNLKVNASLQDICHPANLRMLKANKNLRKNRKSCLTASQLKVAITEWNKKFGKPFSVYRGNIKFKHP